MEKPNRTAAAIKEGTLSPELLSPAGSYEALMAAIDGGADAVYMGGAAFNARIHAKNFTEEELKRGIALAHSYGVKIYIAANTLVYDRELDGFLRAVEYAYKNGADALIIADLGAASEVAKRIPIELHASTQLSGHCTETSELLANAGFSRMVCAREMNYRDIKSFTDGSSLEAEVFVHGALCVCHSGQCLFSSLVGGRSGNRGECAQPCRLPYKTNNGKNGYPLSLKDLTLARHVTELFELGVASLKIEGRMKSPEYVRDVTRIWRRLLDEKRNASSDEIKELEAVFSRGGFTDAYFTGKIGHNMLGVRSEEQKQVSRELVPFNGISRKIKLKMDISVIENIPVTLTVSRLDNVASVSVVGDVPQIARTAPIDYDTVKRSLSKLGDTPYVLDDLNIKIDGGLMMPVSVLNALRRRAVDELNLCGAREIREVKCVSHKNIPSNTRTPQRTAVFYNTESIPPSAYSYFDIIYTPLEKYNGNSNGVLLPPIVFDSERDKVEKMLLDAEKKGAEHALVSNLGHIGLLKKTHMLLHGDFRLNVTNNSSAAFFETVGFDDVILSPELSIPQMRDIKGRVSVCVYGRIPLMITEKCVGREIASCGTCDKGKVILKDRKNAAFPVLRTFDHRSTVFNSVPVYMADRQTELDKAGLCMRHYIFVDESITQADGVINAYRKRIPPKTSEAVRRIK